ncbi:MAG: D-glycero-beta-D-manno-heptose-7-phosphate kinase [Zoogloeaceae bacterium]|jgi:rfaE bifunctional protein kinase chain/domain|nr:D-glycero-beta-D-manno-heptose-7-phosphate kinase [Zoogloeaceae bacterium]
MAFLDALKDIRLLVAGDVMLDRYWFGEVERISPEAPVPVVRIGRQEERPGGAANVARNLVALGARCDLLSVVGADEAGGTLARLLNEAKVDARLHTDTGFDTTVKLRVIGRQQQLLRIDFEKLPSHEILGAKLKAYTALLPRCDAVVLSDYGKGGLTHITEMIRLARAAEKPVLVDPKGDDFSRYAGATVITPNRGEFQAVAGRWRSEAELAEKAERLRRELELAALLVTRSEEGMTLFSAAEGHPLVIHEAARAREVFDVSGAGDTVIATLAAALAAGADWRLAIHAANVAAGIVVGKLGTATVTRQELAAALASGQAA